MADAPPTWVTARTSDGSVQVLLPRDSGANDVGVTTADGSRLVAVPTDPGSSGHVDVRTSDGSGRIGSAG